MTGCLIVNQKLKNLSVQKISSLSVVAQFIVYNVVFATQAAQQYICVMMMMLMMMVHLVFPYLSITRAPFEVIYTLWSL